MKEVRDCLKRLTCVIVLEEIGKIEMLYKRQKTTFTLPIGESITIERDEIVTTVNRRTTFDYDIQSYIKTSK